MIRASGGLIERKSRLSVSLAISPSAPASSTPVGPPPTTTNVIHSRAALEVLLALGRLEGDEDAAPDLERVVDRLEAGGVRRPVVVAEVRVTRARGHDQRVVGERPAVGHQDLARARDRARPPRRAGRSCSPPCGGSSAAAARCRPARCARRDLVEQRLEQVEVAPVDEGDEHPRVPTEHRGPR